MRYIKFYNMYLQFEEKLLTLNRTIKNIKIENIEIEDQIQNSTPISNFKLENKLSRNNKILTNLEEQLNQLNEKNLYLNEKLPVDFKVYISVIKQQEIETENKKLLENKLKLLNESFLAPKLLNTSNEKLELSYHVKTHFQRRNLNDQIKEKQAQILQLRKEALKRDKFEISEDLVSILIKLLNTSQIYLNY